MEKEVRFFLSRSQKPLIHSLTARKQTFSNNVKVILSSSPHWLWFAKLPGTICCNW